jgi:hypothetical protein
MRELVTGALKKRTDSFYEVCQRNIIKRDRFTPAEVKAILLRGTK